MTSPLSPGERASELLARMTPIEKAQQLSAAMSTGLAGPDALATRLGNGIGQISAANLTGDRPEHIATLNNSIQRFLVEGTRLGIPAILHGEALNGFVAAGYSSFPTAIALAATWDPAAVEEMTRIIRNQMRSVGVRQALSPVVDIARDARWGRVHETYGEDVLLTSAMGVAFVRGLQGEDLTEGVLATAKHFLGYAMTDGGLNTAQTLISSRELYDIYASPFEALIHEAHLAGVMNSYSDVNGIPVGASHEILTELLRGRMGFIGSVISDYGTVEQFLSRQKIAATPEEAGAMAVTAGLDVELPDIVGYGEHLVTALDSGLLAPDILDTAVHRVLTDKFALGLFENPYVSEDPIVLGEVARQGSELSRRLATEAVTLIKNDGLLPLPKATRSIAVVGPHADAALASFAGYTYPANIGMMQGLVTGESRMAGMEVMDEIITPGSPFAEAIKQLASIDLEQVVRHAYGASSLVDAMRTLLPDAEIVSAAGTGFVDHQPHDIPGAVDLAAGADLVILAIGGRAGASGHNLTEGEMTDSTRIELPRRQVELVRAVVQTGVPVVGVVWMGRPYALTEIEELLPAILTAYYPGPEGGRAIADVLFGDADPAGRLPFTLPRSTGQVPIYYGQKNGSGYRRANPDGVGGYIDSSSTPLYPFGHGLGYTTFSYGKLRLSAEEVDVNGSVTITVPVTNTGARPGAEVVQVYISDTATVITRPERQLAGFARVDLAPGETADVSLTITLSQLGYSGVDGTFILEPGAIQVRAGASSSDIRAETEFTVTGPTTSFEGRRSYLPHVHVNRSAPIPAG